MSDILAPGLSNVNGNGTISLNGQPFELPPSDEADPQNNTLLQRYATQANFHLRLPNYEGPLDVLLRLIEDKLGISR